MKVPPIRVGTGDDIPAALDLLRAAADEFPFGAFSDTTCATTMHDCLTRGALLLSLSHGRPVALALLFITPSWWTDDLAIHHICTFVHPEHRRAPHARGLLRAVKAVAEELHMPLIPEVFSTQRTLGKVRLYQAEFGAPVGATFMVDAQ